MTDARSALVLRRPGGLWMRPASTSGAGCWSTATWSDSVVEYALQRTDVLCWCDEQDPDVRLRGQGKHEILWPEDVVMGDDSLHGPATPQATATSATSACCRDRPREVGGGDKRHEGLEVAQLRDDNARLCL